MGLLNLKERDIVKEAMNGKVFLLFNVNNSINVLKLFNWDLT